MRGGGEIRVFSYFLREFTRPSAAVIQIYSNEFFVCCISKKAVRFMIFVSREIIETISKKLIRFKYMVYLQANLSRKLKKKTRIN